MPLNSPFMLGYQYIASLSYRHGCRKMADLSEQIPSCALQTWSILRLSYKQTIINVYILSNINKYQFIMLFTYSQISNGSYT